MLNRIKIIQRLIRVTGAKNYLEIGVKTGTCFLRIKASQKMGVDPSLKIAFGRRLKYFVKNPTNVNNQYFEQTSDDFFATKAEMLGNNRPKVVFIDGLHTYEQSLRDVLNSLNFLDDGGVILMHDCNPLTEAAASSVNPFEDAVRQDLSTFEGVWNGDVWKTVVHLRSLHKDLEVCVLDCDHGIGVVRRGIPEETLHFSPDEITNLSYHELQTDRRRLLNLKPPEFLNELLPKILSGSRVSGTGKISA